MVRFLISLTGALGLFLVAGCAATERGGAPAPALRHIDADEGTGTSTATVVGDVPLIHTNQFLASDPAGNVVGADLEAQLGRAVENLRLALAEVRAELRDLAKLNVYVKTDEARERILTLLPSVLGSGVWPAVSFVASTLPHPEALIAIDAVAVAPGIADAGRITFHRSEALSGPEDQAHLAILPAGGKVYLAGQAARGEDLIQATRETMKGLHATLAYLGLSADDVVQVKAFYTPMSDPAEVERVIAEYYRRKPAPPVISVEWSMSSLPTEIELIATRGGRGPASSSEPISYITPPGVNASKVFSRIAEVHGGELVFLSGLFPEAGQDAEVQVRSLFETMGGILERAGSDFNSLVKATYYVSEDGTSRALNEIRPDYFDPARPPAASKIPVHSVGQPGTAVTLDMIGIVSR